MMSGARLSPAGGGGRPVLSWIAGLSCGLILMVTPATVLLLAAGLAPSILVRLLDDTEDRSVCRPVLLCSVTAMIAPMIRLWRSGPPELGRALSILSEPRVLCSAWLAGAAAWVGSELLTVLVHRCLTVRDSNVAARMTAEIERLREEWGPESERSEA